MSINRDKSLGKTIKYARKKAGISQQELANRLHITRGLVSQYETGTRVPKFGTVERIATALGTSSEFLYEIHPEGFDTQEEYEAAKKEQDYFKEYNRQQLMRVIFHQLNESGQKKTLRYAQDLALIKEYTKEEYQPEVDARTIDKLTIELSDPEE